MTQLNVLLVGEESAGIQMLRILAKSTHNIVAVMAQPSKDSKTPTLWNTAEKLGFKTIDAINVKDANFANQIREDDVDLILNVHSLYLMNGAIIEAAKIGAYNMHPGPLPKYAGLNVNSWAIYNGETEHGVTIHEMVPRIDAGTIAYQAMFPITDKDTGLTTMSKCVRAGVPLLEQLLAAAAQGKDAIPQIEQDFTQRGYFNRKPPNGGMMDWNRYAADVYNHIRAADYSPFPTPWGHPLCQVDDKEIGIVKAELTGSVCNVEPGTVTDKTDRGVMVATADEWILVKKIEFAGNYGSANDVLNTGDFLMTECTATA